MSMDTEYVYKSILNEKNVIESNNKKGHVKINGQAIEANRRDTTIPKIPAKPSRDLLSRKKIGETAIQPNNTADQIDSSAPKVNKAEVFETEEIEFSLDEIRDLEVPACRTDSEQEDFEIAGSRADLDLSLHLDSPIDTSWYYFSIYY